MIDASFYQPSSRARFSGRRKAVLFEKLQKLHRSGHSTAAAAFLIGISESTAWRWHRRVKKQPKNIAAALTPQVYKSGRRSPLRSLLTPEIVGEVETLAVKLKSVRRAWRAWLKDNRDTCPNEIREALENRSCLPEPLAKAAKLKRTNCEAYVAPSGLMAVHLPDGRSIYVEPPVTPAVSK